VSDENSKIVGKQDVRLNGVIFSGVGTEECKEFYPRNPSVDKISERDIALGVNFHQSPTLADILFISSPEPKSWLHSWRLCHLLPTRAFLTWNGYTKQERRGP